MNNNTQDIETTNKTIINDEEISTKDISTILQILSLEKQNNKSSKKLSQQEIVNKILNIIRREAENEIH